MGGAREREGRRRGLRERKGKEKEEREGEGREETMEHVKLRSKIADGK